MRSFPARVLRSLLYRTLGKERMEAIVSRAARLLDLDLQVLGYRSAGILNYETAERSGEAFLMQTVLRRTIIDPSPVLFDVGANVGEMASMLRQTFPSARVVAFEPNPVTFEALTKGVGEAVECIAAGLGSTEGSGTLYCYRRDQQSGHASVYRDVFEIYEGYGVEGARDLTSFEFPIRTLDAVCRELGIEKIDFLKIDVEGHEIEVLRGATGMLAKRGISLIQFEFNDCHVMSRTFMRDFYDLLHDFTFFRLGPDHLIPMGPYAARLEIFQYQNVLAVRSDRMNAPEWQAVLGEK